VSDSAVSPLAACADVEVSWRRGGRALRGVSLEIGPHDSIALLGRSGSGKTTLLHVLGGLLEPTSGQVIWRGHELTRLDWVARRGARSGGIAYVFQGANLLPHFTAFENVAFAAELARDRADVSLATDELLELVGLASKANGLPDELSGGEAQRVAIARALAQQPDLLLCDEPTGHLDSDTANRVLDLIEALRAEYRFALVVATHDSDVAARLRREVELEDGRVVREEAR
jgi:ABC-type lipoprotein export system ATPase subunit